MRSIAGMGFTWMPRSLATSLLVEHDEVMQRLGLAQFLGAMICSIGMAVAQEEDSAAGLPEKYANDYLIGKNTISPDKNFAVIYPANEPNESSELGDYVVALKPFAIVTKLTTKRPYFKNENHGSLEATWSNDGSAVLVTLGIKWGPGDVFLVELKNGKAARTTNLLAKIHALLAPDLRKAKSKTYNDEYDFIFEADNDGFQFDNAGQVRVKVLATSDPKGSSSHVWERRFEGTWDVAKAKFTTAKVTRDSPEAPTDKAGD
jgi:hypothetical protein